MYMEYAEQANSEGRQWVSGCQGRGREEMGSDCFVGLGFLGDEENILEADGGGGRATP